MNPSSLPVLLTSSVIAHDRGVRLQNPQERERLAMESIRQWRTISPDTPLVLCDGSSFDFRPLVAALPDGHDIECLNFQNDIAAVQKRGRGYGEGEIVRHAIEHSKLIQSAGCFAKCTSKLWVENFEECLLQWNGDLLLKAVFDNVFTPWKPTTLAYIDTRFYMASLGTYQRLFLHAHHAVHAQQGHSLEECFRDIFLKEQPPTCLMSPPPVISGVGGGTGVYYKNSALRKLKERWRYARVKRNPLFRPWFSEV
ncbi:hypothetical protein [Rhodoferax saidenbachensis]|uniref:Uncharacterized protein n=1 Tax=Rhodoferax saidenbachensis TaxID=1484693 RepID=A0ABU1ZIA8_9BURK|nr:hypothetical protein [Rhodoferax saidenbachensis]MDR7305272.1 hypothetical protein [Rhodoferax saidenbachensis]